MKKLIVAFACCVSMAAVAGETKADMKPVESKTAAAAAPVFTPRKVTREDKKGIDALMAAEEAAMMKGDVEAGALNVDFPVYMVTDNAKGEPIASSYDRKKYVEMMAASMPGMPKDMKMKHSRKYTFLTDTMAIVTDDVTGTMGKTTQSWKSAALVVMRGGKWMWKSQMEGGWGDAPGMKDEPKASGMSGSH